MALVPSASLARTPRAPRDTHNAAAGLLFLEGQSRTEPRIHYVQTADRASIAFPRRRHQSGGCL